MKKLAVGLATITGLAMALTAAQAAQGRHELRDGSTAQAQAYDTGTVRDRSAYIYTDGGYRPSTNRFHDNPYVYGNPDRD